MKSSPIRLVVVSVALMFLVSCATIVRHPEVDQVKKIAVVSLYTNQTIPKVGGGGSNGGGAAFLKKAMSGKDDDSGDTNNRVRLAKFALEKFTHALNQVPGWSVVSFDRVVESNDYQAMGKAQTDNRALAAVADFANRIDQAKYNTPPKMWAIQLSKNEQTLRPALAGLCKKLGVDAVAIVDVDLAYESGFFSIAGTGAAHASVASSTVVLNKDGQYAVVFPQIQPSGGDRFDSETNITMLGGKISMSGDTEKAFQEAIEKAAMDTTKVIQAGLAKK